MHTTLTSMDFAGIEQRVLSHYVDLLGRYQYRMDLCKARTKLNDARREYNKARVWLGYYANGTKAQRSRCFSNLNVARAKLKREIKAVSHLLWPNAGRPRRCQEGRSL